MGQLKIRFSEQIDTPAWDKLLVERREIEEGGQTTYFCIKLCGVTNIPVPLAPQLPLDLELEGVVNRGGVCLPKSFFYRNIKKQYQLRTPALGITMVVWRPVSSMIRSSTENTRLCFEVFYP